MLGLVVPGKEILSSVVDMTNSHFIASSSESVMYDLESVFGGI
jgi:hypothetical protein